MSYKRPRIAELAGGKVVTDAALASVVRKLSENPADFLNEGISRRSIGRSLSSIGATNTASGLVMTSINLLLNDGTSFPWEVVAPAALLNLLCSACHKFAQALHSLLTAHGSGQPLTLVAYTDEAVPGIQATF